MIFAKKRKLKIFHLNGISANFCCFIIGDLSPLLPEPVTIHIKLFHFNLIKANNTQMHGVKRTNLPFLSIARWHCVLVLYWL